MALFGEDGTAEAKELKMPRVHKHGGKNHFSHPMTNKGSSNIL